MWCPQPKRVLVTGTSIMTGAVSDLGFYAGETWPGLGGVSEVPLVAPLCILALLATHTVFSARSTRALPF